MAYVLNKLRNATQNQNEVKQGSSAVSPSGGVGGVANKTSAFASPMDLINANKGNQNLAVGQRINTAIGKNTSDVMNADTKNAGINSYSQPDLNYKTMYDDVLEQTTNYTTPEIKPYSFQTDTASTFGQQKTGKIPTSIIKPEGGQYTEGMGNLDQILARRSETIGKGINQEAASQNDIWGNRNKILSDVGGYNEAMYALNRTMDFGNTYGKFLAAKNAGIQESVRGAATQETAARAKTKQDAQDAIDAEAKIAADLEAKRIKDAQDASNKLASDLKQKDIDAENNRLAAIAAEEEANRIRGATTLEKINQGNPATTTGLTEYTQADADADAAKERSKAINAKNKRNTVAGKINRSLGKAMDYIGF